MAIIRPSRQPTDREIAAVMRAMDAVADYMHARYHSPGLGRLLSVDPVGGNPRAPQSWNRYAYVLNNPLKYIDPRGLQAECADETVDGELLPCAESITIVEDDPTTEPSFNPLTGVQGLGDLIRGRSLLGSFSLPDSRVSRAGVVPTIGPLPEQRTGLPFSFASLTVSVGVLGIGGTGGVVVDAHGNVYLGLGLNAGKSIFPVNASLTAGTPLDGDIDAALLEDALSGFSNNFTLGLGGAGGVTRSGFSGPRFHETGFAGPTVGVSSVYFWNVGGRIE